MHGSLGASVSWCVTEENGSRPPVSMSPLSKVSLSPQNVYWFPRGPLSFSFFTRVGIAGPNESPLHVLFCHLLSVSQVLVSLGASERLAMLSLGNQLLPHSSPRPASAKHCRKLIHLLRPTHSTWSQIPTVHPPTFVTPLLPTFFYYSSHQLNQELKGTKKRDKLQVKWFKNKKLEEIYV